jgi:DNA-binding MarR family transcriptional regulator
VSPELDERNMSESMTSSNLMTMNALDLFLLGRKLAKLGMETLPSSTVSALPPSATAVFIDVLEVPVSSIGEIARRTELPQSQVSAAVVTLVEHCLVETVSDPNDRRRTLVRAAPGVARQIRSKVDVPIDHTIADALGNESPKELAQVLEALEMLSLRLSPRILNWTPEDIVS